ncbi:hypothetical protein IGI37_003133 [Enterococcus sp. AZ194]|uniref:hypothetical protein n=1 Tax=Enterococcus sp. AZ194 TaxID=2774629 RepID=UPI003F1E76F9
MEDKSIVSSLREMNNELSILNANLDVFANQATALQSTVASMTVSMESIKQAFSESTEFIVSSLSTLYEYLVKPIGVDIYKKNIEELSKAIMSGLFTDAEQQVQELWLTRVLEPIGSAILSGAGAINSVVETFSSSIAKSLDDRLIQIDPEKFKSKFTSIAEGAQNTFPRISGAIAHPIFNLKRLMGSFSETSQQFGRSGTVMSGIGTTIQMGISNMASSGIQSFKSLSAVVLTNPITIALLAIVTAVASVAAAWQSNFMNIQGFVKSAFGQIGNSLKSLGSLFTGSIPSLETLGNAFKTVGVIITGTLVVGVALLVDGFRFLVTTVMAVVQGLIVLGKMAVMAAQAMTGNWEGAGKTFNSMGDDIQNIIDGYTDLGKNSATVGVLTESTKELGKETANVVASTIQGFDEMAAKSSDLANRFSESGQKLKDAFTMEDSDTGEQKLSARMAEYFDNTTALVENSQQKKQKIYDTYNQQIEEAATKTEEEKQRIYADASTQMMADLDSQNNGMLAVYSGYSKQLAENKSVDNEVLTEAQREQLQAETELIREALQEQSEAYVQAGISKLDNMEALSVSEQESMLANMEVLGVTQQEKLTENEEKIKGLKKQFSDAKTEEEKAGYAQQIGDLTEQNTLIQEKYAEQGTQILETLVNNGEMNAETISASLQNVGTITDEHLMALLNSYVENGASLDEQFILMAGMMESRGLEGSNKLVQALRSGDYTAVGTMSREEIMKGLELLPEDMFAGGESGVQSFLTAIQNGNTNSEQLGKQLSTYLKTGIDTSSIDVSKASEKSMEKANEAGKQKAAEGQNSGKAQIEASVQGVNENAYLLRDATQSAAKGAKEAANNVSFYSVGTNMVTGIASGINNNSGIVLSAISQIMANAKSAANQAINAASPSRWFRDNTGKFISQGVAVGIKRYGIEAVENAKTMLSQVKHAVGGPEGFDQSLSFEAQVNHVVESPVQERLLEAFHEIKQLKIVIDSGALVGEIGQPMNGYLGNKMNYESRYR